MSDSQSAFDALLTGKDGRVDVRVSHLLALKAFSADVQLTSDLHTGATGETLVEL